MRYKLQLKINNKCLEDLERLQSSYIPTDYVVGLDVLKDWNKRNKCLHILIKDIFKCRVIASVTLIPLTKEQYDLLLSGNMKISEIDRFTLIDYDEVSECYLYLYSIVIDEKYQKDRRLLSFLLTELKKKFEYIIKKNISVKNFCSVGYTEDGIKFIENILNLKKVNDNDYPIYTYEELDDFYKWFSIFPAYINMYNKKYDVLDVIY